MKRRTLLMASPMLLGGCAGSLLPKPSRSPTSFTLDDGSSAATAVSTADGAPVLLVDMPRAAPGFDSKRMIYTRRPQELEAYAFSEWVETPARLLAPMLVRSLQSGGAFGAVMLAPSAALGTLRLESELIRLQQDFNVYPSIVRLTVRATLLDASTRAVIASREFDEREASLSEDASGGAAAGQRAIQRLLTEFSAFFSQQARLRPSAAGSDK